MQKWSTAKKHNSLDGLLIVTAYHLLERAGRDLKHWQMQSVGFGGTFEKYFLSKTLW